MKITRSVCSDPTTLNEVAQHVIDRINRNCSKQGVQVAGFSWDIRYGDVSNSHDAPVGGVTCWSSREAEDGRPRSYPGWSGRVWIRYSEPFKGFGRDPFEGTLTYPGTGGWGSYGGPWENIASIRFKTYGNTHPKDCYPEPQIYSWDYRFFESDFPDLRFGRAIARLSGDESGLDKHKFIWEDSEIVRLDNEFIKSVALMREGVE